MGSGFLRDIALRKQLEEKVKEATKTRQAAEAEINAAKTLIDGAKAIDGTVTDAESALAEATSLMSGKDYRSALEKAAEAKERGKRAYAERARHFLDSTKSLLGVTKGMGVDDKEGLQALDKAEEAYAKEALPESIDLAKKAWKKSEKVLHEHLSSSFSTAQSLIITANPLGQTLELQTSQHFPEFFGLPTTDREELKRVLAERAGIPPNAPQAPPGTPPASPSPESAAGTS